MASQYHLYPRDVILYIIWIFTSCTFCLLSLTWWIWLYEHHNAMGSVTMTCFAVIIRLQQVKICSDTIAVSPEIRERSCLPSESLMCAGISRKIPLHPLPSLKWGLERGRPWLQPLPITQVHCGYWTRTILLVSFPFSRATLI